jgi:iron complex transport system substrate-binding protein
MTRGVSDMRICSLLPSTTEVVCALGLADNLVGVTHECDYPPEVRDKSKVIMSFINPDELSSREIDDLITKNRNEGKSTYLIDIGELKKANPDIILTQGLCEVCAVSGNEVVESVKALGRTPKVISFEPSTIDQILDAILKIGDATDTKGRADELVEKLKLRIHRIESLFSGERDRPRVFCMEWLDPPYAAGHWIPEMVELAGGANGIGKPGEPSRKVSWDDIYDFAPQIITVMPCGFNIEDTLKEIDTVTSHKYWNQMPASRRGHVYLVDANSYFSRSGPRIVDGLEILAKIIHPEALEFDFPNNSVLNLRNHYYFELNLG